MEAQLEIISACQRQSFHYKIENEVWPVYHFHPEFDLLYFKKDSGRVIAGDYIDNFQTGSLFLLSPNIPHAFHASERINNEDDDAVYVVQFSLDSLGKDFLNKYEMEGIHNFLLECRQGYEITGEDCKDACELIEGMNERNTALKLASLISILDILSEFPDNNLNKLTSPA